MINVYVAGLAEQMGIKLSHVSILNNAAFSNSNRKSLKISSGDRLVFVPFMSEELIDGNVSEDLKMRISNVLSDLSGLSEKPLGGESPLL
jgi:hypothetical protein